MKECRGVPRCPTTTVQSVGTVTVCRRIRRVNPAQELQASRVKEVGTERKEHVMERPAPPESQSIFIGVQGRFDAESWMQCFGTPMKTPHDKRVLLEVCIASVDDAQSTGRRRRSCRAERCPGTRWTDTISGHAHGSNTYRQPAGHRHDPAAQRWFRL